MRASKDDGPPAADSSFERFVAPSHIRIWCDFRPRRFRPVDERVVPLTVSIGGTLCGEDAAVSELMRAADQCLYEAKHRGRNLTILDNDMSEAA